MANIIRQSGRRVVWTMAPNKSVPLQRYLVPKNFPHGRCDRKNLADQTRFMRSYDPPGYLSMVDPLAASKHEVYWKTDPHWTTVAGALYATRVAQTLDPRLARRQSYAYATESRVGQYASLLGEDSPETVTTALPTTRVAVRTAPDSTSDWPGWPSLVWDHSWDATPRSRTWPGHTLVLGDSFTLVALESLRPLFHHGRYLWVNGVPEQSLIDGIVGADTVVLEVVENFLYLDQPVLHRSFRAQLRRALR